MDWRLKKMIGMLFIILLLTAGVLVFTCGNFHFTREQVFFEATRIRPGTIQVLEVKRNFFSPSEVLVVTDFAKTFTFRVWTNPREGITKIEEQEKVFALK